MRQHRNEHRNRKLRGGERSVQAVNVGNLFSSCKKSQQNMVITHTQQRPSLAHWIKEAGARLDYGAALKSGPGRSSVGVSLTVMDSSATT